MKTITTKEVIKIIDENKKGFVLIDVRKRIEIKNYGTIPRSINIPLDEIEAVFDRPPEEIEKKYGFNPEKNTIVTFCRSGGRSAYASEIIEDSGYESVNYKGSILEWAKHDPYVKKY